MNWCNCSPDKTGAKWMASQSNKLIKLYTEWKCHTCDNISTLAHAADIANSYPNKPTSACTIYMFLNKMKHVGMFYPYFLKSITGDIGTEEQNRKWAIRRILYEPDPQYNYIVWGRKRRKIAFNIGKLAIQMTQNPDILEEMVMPTLHYFYEMGMHTSPDNIVAAARLAITELKSTKYERAKQKLHYPRKTGAGKSRVKTVLNRINLKIGENRNQLNTNLSNVIK